MAKLTGKEIKDVLGLSGIFGLRMLGLFLVLPVLSVHALGLEGATPMLAGLSVGIYGLAQTVFQVPFGMISDRFDRKSVVAAGLLLFMAGSVLCALAESAQALIAGRFLQGAGAIASVIIAMVADRTRDEVRGRAMALIGISVGLSFGFGILMGPMLAVKIGVPAIFWAIALSGLAAIVYLYTLLPAVKERPQSVITRAKLGELLRHGDLLRLDALMFVLHLGMTAVFVVGPVLMLEHWDKQELWKVYLPMILAGGGLMFPAVALAEKRNAMKSLVGAGIVVMAAGYGLLALSAGSAGLVAAGMIVFFVGFNFIEPALPSLVTRVAPADLRGTAVGFFNMSQFFGAFCGGAVGGWFLGASRESLFWVLLGLCVPWVFALAGFKPPPPRKRSA
jgi:predicted MFS family arabinose efflux permease